MAQVKNQRQKNRVIHNNLNTISITYYTDPLCCWSWAFEPQWRKLKFSLGNRLSYRYCMGGLISHWKTFSDSVNSISRPFQMGSLWAQASQQSGMPIDDKIWMTDPPATSYMACVAVKCAALQGIEAEEKYLRKVREAVMLNRSNVARKEILFDIASDLSKEKKGFLNVDSFMLDFNSGKGTDAFKKDLQEVQYKRIQRFPSLVIQKAGAGPTIMIGYNNYEGLLNAIGPDFIGPPVYIDQHQYQNYYGNVMEREMKEIM